MKLTQELLESHIDSESYHRFEGTTVTVCCLTLDNGFHVIGQSACIEASMFDADIGKKVAKDDAVNKLWQLYGFNAKQQTFTTRSNDL